MTEEKFNEIFSNNLTWYLNKSGKNQIDLAEELGVSPAAVSDWCTGKKSPRMKNLDAICNFFGIKRSDLMEKHEDFTVPDLKGVYLSFAKEAQDEGIDPEDIRNALDLIKKLRGEK